MTRTCSIAAFTPGSPFLVTATSLLIWSVMCILPVAANDKTDQTVHRLVAEFDQLLATGQGQQALQQLERMQRGHSEHPLVLAVAGQVQMMQNNVPAATASLNKALEKEPNQPRATALLANIEFRTGRGEQAHKRVEDALATHPKNVELLVIFGQMKMARQEFPAAEDVFVKILDMEEAPPQSKATAHAQIATLKAQQGQHDKAAMALTEAMRLQWHPDLAMALIEQSEKAGNAEKALAAARDFKIKLNNPQLAQIRQQALSRIEPIEQRMQLLKIEDQLNKGETLAGRLALDRFKREAMNNPATRSQHEAAVRRLELVERTKLLTLSMEKGYTVDALTRPIADINELVKGQQGEHVDAALVAVAEAQKRIDQVQATEVPAVLELLRSGVTLQQLELPDPKMKETLKQKGLGAYRELSSAAKQAIEDYYKPMAEARRPAPFESLMIPYLEKPSDSTLRQALLDSFWKQVENFDTQAPGASRQQVIADRVFTRPESSGPAIPSSLKRKRDNDAYTARDQFNDTDLITARRWQDIISGYQRSEAIYPLSNVLEDIARTHFLAGNHRAAADYMALSAAVDMYERAHSFRQDSGSIMGGSRDMLRLSWAQSLRALSDGRKISKGPGRNDALSKVLDDIKNGRWVEVAEYVADKHEDSPIDSWFATQIKFGPQVHRQEMIDGLVAAAEAAEAAKDPQRFTQIALIAKSLFLENSPVFALPKAKAAANDEERLQILRYALATDLRHSQTNIAMAEALERQGKLTEALGHYNVAALGRKLSSLQDPHRKAAAQQRDRLLGQLRSEKSEFAFMAGLTNEIYGELGKDFRNRYLAALTEAHVNTLIEMGIQDRRNALQIRSDARRSMGDWLPAIEDLNEIIRLDPKHQMVPQLQCLLGDCHRELGQTEQAMQHYNLSIEAGYRDARVYNARGNLHRSASNTTAALADYSSAIEIDPDNQFALTKRSEIYEYVLKDDDKALVDLKKIEQLLKDQGKDTTLSTVSLRIHNILARQLSKPFSN